MEGEIKEYLIKIKSIKTNIESEHNLKTIQGRNETNGHILWSIELEFFDKILKTNPDYMLSNALNEIRRKIEPKGFRLGVKWCEIDAYQSGMLADMGAGTMMYYAKEVDEVNKEKSSSIGYTTYHIFEPTEFSKVVNLDVQNNYVNEWRMKYRPQIQTESQPERNWIQRLLKRIIT